MLIEFSVKNFLSFKDKVTLSMEKGTGDENLDNTFEYNDINLLKTTAIYGANASGKTNLLKALTCGILMVRTSNMLGVNDKWNLIRPFMFDEDSKNLPSEFEFIFIAGGHKYKYYFSADSFKVYDESLDVYYSQKPTNIFKRSNINHYEFNSDKNKLDSIASKNTDNKLFLSTATTWNYDKTKEAFLWFLNSIDTYDSFDMISNNDLVEYNKNNNNIKEFALNLLKEADILIKNIDVSYEEIDSSMVGIPSPQIVRNIPLIKYDIELEHEVINKDNVKNSYKLKFNDESSGTRALFSLAPFLKRAFENQKIMIIDELERSMHPSLVEFIIKLFHNKYINKSNSQLIFMTHATNLLNLDLLRRDQIWFTEKNQDTGVSDLYPLDSFSVRKDENIQKGYINGRYGATPFIKDLDLWAGNN